MSNLPTTTKGTAVGFTSAESFELMQRVAGAFTSSDLVPEAFRGQSKLGNAVIALELSARIGASPLMVMQNLNVIHGRPAFSSKFIISAINTCGKFSPLRFKMEQKGRKKVEYMYWVGKAPNREKKTASVEIDDIRCTAYASELATGEILEGPTVSMEMAVLEGWYTKSDSKWKTMPDLMLRYRAASFFGNLYAPEILMGMSTVEEVQDVIDVTPVPVEAATESINEAIKKRSSSRKKEQPESPQSRIVEAEFTENEVDSVQSDEKSVIDTAVEKATSPEPEAELDASGSENGDLW